MDTNRWARVGLLTLAIEYFKEQQEHDRLVALRESIEKESQARWAECDASWDRFHAKMKERLDRINAIEIK